MANILDLPFEVLDIIFEYLFCIEPQVELLPKHTRIIAAKLRLVCRNWADWLFENHLYKKIDIRGDTAYRKIELIDHLTNRSTSLAQTQCHYLKTTDLRPYPPIEPEEDTACPDFSVPSLRRADFRHPWWIWPKPDELWKRTHDKNEEPVKSAFEVFGALVEHFSDSILRLRIDFGDFLLLPIGTIEAIGRIRNLRTLQIYYFAIVWGRWRPGPFEPPMDKSMCSSISGIHKINRFDLMELYSSGIFLSRTIGSGSSLNNHQPVGITQLVIHFPTCGLPPPLDRMANLVSGFKHTIKSLEIHSKREGDAPMMVHIFGILRETLEGLFVDDSVILSHIFDFKFPKLRVFSMDMSTSRTCIADLFAQNLFSHAPIETISIDGNFYNEGGAPFNADLFANMPTLRRLVFTYCRKGYLPPEPLQVICKQHGIEWTTFSGTREDQKSMLMKL
ncbi:hypothetical protein PSTG_15279 [Puccinia striiformis f. sp. tritici PST-78]|uniref:Uncharacterized protein n=1 Tax=Puccinia striiformis f. sp. tritici PST-78 TaxID=1165861 RepID=A0A0L0UW65_9BASI|nr:hypothetical protein PSTG_15279 [Puccinia striiformis f. sp. tritici PST-78]